MIASTGTDLIFVGFFETSSHSSFHNCQTSVGLLSDTMRGGKERYLMR